MKTAQAIDPLYFAKEVLSSSRSVVYVPRWGFSVHLLYTLAPKFMWRYFPRLLPKVKWEG